MGPFCKGKETIVERGDSSKKMRQTYQVYIKIWGGTLYKSTKFTWVICNRGSSGCGIHKYIINHGDKTQT